MLKTPPNPPQNPPSKRVWCEPCTVASRAGFRSSKSRSTRYPVNEAIRFLRPEGDPGKLQSKVGRLHRRSRPTEPPGVQPGDAGRHLNLKMHTAAAQVRAQAYRCSIAAADQDRAGCWSNPEPRIEDTPGDR